MIYLFRIPMNWQNISTTLLPSDNNLHMIFNSTVKVTTFVIFDR